MGQLGDKKHSFWALQKETKVGKGPGEQRILKVTYA